MKNVAAAAKNRFNTIMEDDRILYVATPLMIVGSIVAASYIASKLPNNEEDE